LGALTAPKEPPDYESTPLSRSEYIMAIVHLYRGELHRATAWRMRLDTTTNWAVLTSAGLLAFGFRSAENPHWPMLFGTLLITLLLGYEARRFQMFDVWRSRLRKIEENFYGPILRRNPVSPQKEWGERVATDLLAPSYKLGYRQAVRARFVRNYWAIYAVLLLSWCVKVAIHPYPATSWTMVRDNVGHGILWWFPVGYVASLLVGFTALVFMVPPMPHDLDEFWQEGLDVGSTSSLDA
jgi:uncharacterized membrane protein